MSCNSSINGEDIPKISEVVAASTTSIGGKSTGAEGGVPSGQVKIPPPLNRSRTDSRIIYTPPSIGEAPGSTFYIRKNGQMDYMVLLKVSPLC